MNPNRTAHPLRQPRALFGRRQRARCAGREPRAGQVRPALILLVVFLLAATAILLSPLYLFGPETETPRASSPRGSLDRPAVEERRVGDRSPGARGAVEGEIRSDPTPPRGDPATVGDPVSAAPRQQELAAPIERSPLAASSAERRPVPAAPAESPSPRPYGSPSEEAGGDEPIRRDLSGWVFDPAGEPVAGLEVGAVARRLAPASATAAVDAGDRRRTTTTNENGFFGFPRLLDGEYEVHTASTERYERTVARVRAGVDSAVLVVTAKVNRSVLVYGVVESTRGEQLAGVRVIPTGRPASAALSDGLGSYEVRLPVGGRRPSHTLRFLHDGYREVRLSLAKSELLDVEEVKLDALLEPIEGQAVVTGRVTGSDGLAIQGAQLQLYSAAVKRRETAVSDRDGHFTFRNVQFASDYRLWVHPQRGYKDHIEEGLVVDAAGRDLAVVVEALELAGLRGRMLDPDGTPVPGVSLWLRTAYEGAQRASVVTGGLQGDFLVERLPEGPLTLQTHASPYFSFSGIELSPGMITPVRLVLDTGSHKLDGFVLDADRRPVPGAQVSLLWSSRESGVLSRSHRQTTTDAGGYFLFTRLGSGRHTLAASAEGYRSARLDPQVGADSSEVRVYLQEDPG